ncbi:MAG TPA: hypothetical protein PKN32_04575 [Bacteroidales bacterium]|nr:hypothetical protein [Bacteroidales bacterium]
MNLAMLFAILICLSLAWIIGALTKIVFRFEPEKDFLFDTFIKLVLGLFVIITVYAIIVTGFNTILIGLILLSVLYLYRCRKRENAEGVFKKHFNIIYFKALSIALSFGVLFFVFQGLFFYNSPYNNLPHGDCTGYYYKIINFLSLDGVEGLSKSLYLVTDQCSPTPYHYGELWLASLISRVFDVLSVESYTIAVHSILGTILVLGMISLSRLIFKSFILQIFAVLFIFVSGISFYNFMPQTSSYLFAIGWNPKLIIVSIFFVWFSILLINKNKYFYFPLLILPILNIGSAPAVLTALVFFAVYRILFKKKDCFNAKSIFVDTIFCGLFIMLFYFLNSGSSASGDLSLTNIITGLSIDKLKPFKITGGTVIITIAIYFVYLIPIVPILFSSYRKQIFINLKQINYHLLFFVLFTVFGLFYWSCTHPFNQSMQFFYMASLLYLNILIFIIYAKVFQVLKEFKYKYFYVFNFIICLLLLFNICTLSKSPFYKFQKVTDLYSLEYLSRLSQKLEENKKNEIQMIAYLSSEENLKNYWNALVTSPNDVSLPMFTEDYYIINMTCFNIPIKDFDEINKQRIITTMQPSAFYIFVKNQNIKDLSQQQIEEMQQMFIKKNNIKYILLDPNTTLPDIYINDVNDVLYDKLSGKSFITLK